MAIIEAQAQETILNLLKQRNAMDIEEISQELYRDYAMSERTVKENILRLREEGKIKPNKQWKMEIKN